MELTRDEARVKRDFFPKLKRALAHVPFAEDVVAAYFCAFDPATPARAKAILLGALAYFIMPIDVIPDVLLGFGFTDDMAVLLAAFNMIRVHLKPVHRERARAAMEKIRQDQPVFE